jgi:hypothetical protein
MIDPVISGYVLAGIAGLAGGGLIAAAASAGMPGPDQDVPKRPWPKCAWCPAFAGLLAAVILWAVFGRAGEMAVDLIQVTVFGAITGMAGATISRLITER